MDEAGPRIANVLLDGVYGEDVVAEANAGTAAKEEEAEEVASAAPQY
jgi:hypothetical protein